MKFKKAKYYIKYLDEQSGEAWSNDNELLADAMEDYAKMYHEHQVKNCSIPDISQQRELFKSFLERAVEEIQMNCGELPWELQVEAEQLLKLFNFG